ncbi:MAG TPA: asparagine--tRNA ligase [Bacilli bacterium]|nr:MAG: Asparagine--tRNA ligase [Tenericutes bacterium ADurb.BinA124]HNZ49966.1 asparagine--tRNA ligase [Bacilli bacterium]HPX84286.1 asparagine--tRNA ligase [Bacilli bacterium]HQC73999.1 asparagine--tRNA ligase [Bacilli bacterium]
MKLSMRQLSQSFTQLANQFVTVQGWIRTNRSQKEFGFISFNDGSTLATLQIVYDRSLPNFDEVAKWRVGCSLTITGKVVLTPQNKQAYELKAETMILEGDSPEDFPIQPKRHSKEFLREQAHLRPRTNLFNAVFRVRSLLAFAIHEFFRSRDFLYVHAPIITASDAEGAGEMFHVTTLDLNKLPRLADGSIDYTKDFFGKKTNLTVSGQLEAETFAQAFKNVYTFGPTFRAENSNTPRHASEFWMIEPEMAFADLEDDMKLVEDMIKYVINYILKHAKEELAFFDQFVAPGKLMQLQSLVDSHIFRCEYAEAIKILEKQNHLFENKIKYGDDLATEHEKYLTDVHFKAPVFVINWPKEIKAFYMRLNDDGKTVAAMDLLVPGSGELVGGSQREERYEMLMKKMIDQKIPVSEMEWYLDLRKYGGTKHSGFGLGFERLVMYVTGVDNIRDVLPFPRTPKNCEF